MRTTSTLRNNLRPILTPKSISILPPNTPQHQHQHQPQSNSKPKARPFSTIPPQRDLNPPASTLPPPLTFPPPSPQTSKLRTILDNAKAYLKFYRTGAKAVHINYKSTYPIRQTLSSTKYFHHKTKAAALQDAISDNVLDRAQFQLFLRSRHDVSRIPMFGVVLLIMGEWTPLVVMLIPGVVPGTCKIPRQVERERERVAERRKRSLEFLRLQPSSSSSSTESLIPQTITYKDLSRPQLMHISASLDLTSSIWDYIGGPPSLLINAKLRRKMEYLDQDDLLILKEGGADAVAEGKMSLEEVRVALVERGMDVRGVDEAGLRGALGHWLRAREDGGCSVERLLLGG